MRLIGIMVFLGLSFSVLAHTPDPITIRAGKLVLVISNPATAPDAQPVAGTVRLVKLEAADGPHRLHDLLTGATVPITVAGHAATFPITVARWDTVILSLGQS